MRLWLWPAAAFALSAAPPLSKGFEHFYNLEYEQSIGVFEAERRANPSSAAAHNHVAQAILYREMFNAGALESELVSGNNPFLARAKIVPPEAEQKRFDDAIAKAIECSNARLVKNPNDPDGLYTLGVAHGLRANYNFLIRKQWRESLREFTQSRKLHNQVVKLKPSFIDAYMVEGAHDYMVGSLPFTWKLLGFLAGFHGDKDAGLRTVERVAREGEQNRVEAMILLAVAYRRERHAEKAVPLLQSLIAQFPRNYLFPLELVQMYGDLGKKDEALGVLAAMKSAPPAKVQYSRGNLLFWYRDYRAALADLDKSSAAPESIGLNTIVNSWLRKGQCHDMLNERNLAKSAYTKAVALAPDSDAARESRRYLDSPYRRK